MCVQLKVALTGDRELRVRALYLRVDRVPFLLIGYYVRDQSHQVISELVVHGAGPNEP